MTCKQGERDDCRHKKLGNKEEPPTLFQIHPHMLHYFFPYLHTKTSFSCLTETPINCKSLE